MRKITDTLRQGATRIVWFFSMLVVFSCQDYNVEEVFDKSAAERSQESINNLRDLLKSSEHGWTVSYKPSQDETGYYQFVFKFMKDSVVEVASDFSPADLTPKTSNYDVLLGSTTKLSFSTYSSLHKLSDSNFSPIPGNGGAGLKGDFEFLYYGTTEEGDIIFRTNRTQDTLIFHKANANSIADLATSYDNLPKLTGGTSVYRALEEINGSDVVEGQSSFAFPYNARVISIRSVIETEEDGEIVKSFDADYITGYGLTPEGIFLDSVKRADGSSVKHVVFQFDTDEGRFISMLNDGSKLAIGDIYAPIIPVDGQKYFLNAALTSNLFFSFGDPDMGPLTTDAFNELYLAAAPIGLTASFRLYYQLPFGGDSIDYAFLPGTASVINGNVRQLLNYEDLGDRLVMTTNGFRDANSAIKPENEALYNQFMDVLTDPDGWYVENLGRATRFTNLVFTFTSVKDPSIRIGFYHLAP